MEDRVGVISADLVAFGAAGEIQPAISLEVSKKRVDEGHGLVGMGGDRSMVGLDGLRGLFQS